MMMNERASERPMGVGGETSDDEYDEKGEEGCEGS